jgi:hypothetical protein
VGRSVIALSNIILGVYNFIVLGHPDGWRINPSTFSSDILHHVTIKNIRWVSRGVAEYNVYGDKELIGLKIEIWPGRKDPLKIKDLKKSFKTNIYKNINGHNAEIYIGEEKRLGRTFRVINIFFYCDETDRSILLKFVGRDEVEKILDHIEETQCH